MVIMAQLEVTEAKRNDQIKDLQLVGGLYWSLPWITIDQFFIKELVNGDHGPAGSNGG